MAAPCPAAVPHRQKNQPRARLRYLLAALTAKIGSMSGARTVRVVATHDFCCSYSPTTTSYGSLPSGEGLKRAVEAMKEDLSTVWADAGDFAAPGALAALSGGVAGFEAAADLGRRRRLRRPYLSRPQHPAARPAPRTRPRRADLAPRR
jgi:hypothetical protein